MSINRVRPRFGQNTWEAFIWSVTGFKLFGTPFHHLLGFYSSCMFSPKRALSRIASDSLLHAPQRILPLQYTLVLVQAECRALEWRPFWDERLPGTGRGSPRSVR